MTSDDQRLRAALEALVPEAEEPNEWADVLERVAPASSQSHVITTSSPYRCRPSRTVLGRILIAFGAIVVAVGIALAITVPWEGGPTILQRASAAITSPSTTGVLYYEAETLNNSPSYSPPLRTQVWLQETGSHQFVAITTVVTCPNGACERVVWQTGGTLGSHQTLSLYLYDPTRNLLNRLPPPPTSLHALDYDPLATVRAALAAGTGRVVSRGMIGRRHVITIDVPIHDVFGTPGTAEYTVDAETYQPIRMIIHHVRGIALPLGLALPLLPTFYPTSPLQAEITFTAYHHLPATAHNLALANIHNRHPTASITSAAPALNAPPLVSPRYCNRPISVYVNGRCVKASPSNTGG